MMQMHLIKNIGCYSSTHHTRISTPRFLGKKRGKGLHRSSTIVFLEVVDPRHHETSVLSFVLMERVDNSGKMDLLEEGVSHGQLME
jgi:hypothetical protein